MVYEFNKQNNLNKHEKECCHGSGYKAYEILHYGFTALPIIAGLDKFAHALTDWNKYLSPQFNILGNVTTTMSVVGVIEIIAGIGVLLKPSIFAYVVAVWLLAIIINLLLLGNFYDIALRDFGLLLGAVALGLLSQKYCCSVKKYDNVENRL